MKSALTRWLASAFEECLQDNAMSDVGRVIFKLVTGKDISGNDTKSFSLKDWIQAVRQHPDLAGFLEVDGTQPDIAFDAMDLDHSGAVKAQDLEHHLIHIGKTNVCDLCEWLKRHESSDPALQIIRKEMEVQLRLKITDLQRQLTRHNTSLDSIARRAAQQVAACRLGIAIARVSKPAEDGSSAAQQ